MNLDNIKIGTEVWVKGFFDGAGNIDFMNQYNKEFDCLIRDEIENMDDSSLVIDKFVSNSKLDSDFVQISSVEFNDLLKSMQELADLKVAFRILNNAIAFAPKDEVEDDL